MRRSNPVLSAGLTRGWSAGTVVAVRAERRAHNLLIPVLVPTGFVAFKVHSLTPRCAWAESAHKGVNYFSKMTHSLFPTFTLANGSAHGDDRALLGDTGTFSNTIYTGLRQRRPAIPSVPSVKTIAVCWGDVDRAFRLRII